VQHRARDHADIALRRGAERNVAQRDARDLAAARRAAAEEASSMDSPNPKQKASSSTLQQPPPSSPTPKQLSDALRIASSLFAEGLVKLNSGAFTEALPLFEQALSVNQRYLPPSKTECVLCYNQLAAVHDKLGNLQQAFEYYERAKQELSAKEPPKGERDLLSRFKRTPLTSEYTLMPCGTRLSFVHAGYDVNGMSAAKSMAPEFGTERGAQVGCVTSGARLRRFLWAAS
jgi:tetratricopeptide (TPR) repeat protein